MIRADYFGREAFAGDMKRIQRELQGATRSGLRRAIQSTRTAASAEIRKRVALKKSYVDQRLPVRYSQRDADPQWAEIRAARRGILLTRFPNRQLTRKGKTVAKRTAGVSVRVTPGKRPAKMRGAFYVSLRGGNTGIAIREGDSKRTPIKVLHGPSVSQVFNTVRDDLAEDAVRRAEAALDHAVERVITAGTDSNYDYARRRR